MNIFLYKPQDFSNICTISRTLEFFWIEKCYIYDENNLIREKYWKSYKRRLATQSAWAFEKIKFIKVENYLEFFKNYTWRKIITLIDKKAKNLKDYNYKKDDLIIFWNESFWLTDDVIGISDEKIYLKWIWQTQSLNLSNTVAIVVYTILNKKNS